MAPPNSSSFSVSVVYARVGVRDNREGSSLCRFSGNCIIGHRCQSPEMRTVNLHRGHEKSWSGTVEL
jgi:hypothetical protein